MRIFFATKGLCEPEYFEVQYYIYGRYMERIYFRIPLSPMTSSVGETLTRRYCRLKCFLCFIELLIESESDFPCNASAV